MVWFLRLVSRPLPGGLVQPKPRLALCPNSVEALVFVNPLPSVGPFLSVEPYQSTQTSQS